MIRLRIGVLAAALAGGMSGQMVINGGRQITGNWDAGNAQATRPAKTGTTLPASCAAGEVFFKTDAGAGQNLFLCTAVNTWTQISGGAGGAVASVFGRTGAVSAQSGDYTAAQVGAIAAAGAYADLSTAGKIGTSSGTVAAGNDARFTDARTPTAHATSHRNGGTDEIATATPAANAIPKAGAGGALAAGWLPAPAAGALGGVNSKDCTGTGHVQRINTDGTVTCSSDAKSPYEHLFLANPNLSGGYAYGGPWIAPSTNAATASTYSGNPVRRAFVQFADTAMQGIYMLFWLPTDWDGSTITPTLEWVQSSCTGGSTVLWDVRLACAPAGTGIGTGPAFGSVLEISSTPTADTTNQTEFALTSSHIPAACAPNTEAWLFIQRNNADTCTANAYLVAVKVKAGRL